MMDRLAPVRRGSIWYQRQQQHRQQKSLDAGGTATLFKVPKEHTVVPLLVSEHSMGYDWEIHVHGININTYSKEQRGVIKKYAMIYRLYGIILKGCQRYLYSLGELAGLLNMSVKLIHFFSCQMSSLWQRPC